MKLFFRSSLALLLALATSACVPCEDQGANLGDACLPATAAPDEIIEIEVREACGTSCSEPLDCTSKVDLTTVTVITSQLECASDCTSTGSCQTRTVKCQLPALSPGEYTVVLPGLGNRTLTVDSGGATRCTL